MKRSNFIRKLSADGRRWAQMKGKGLGVGELGGPFTSHVSLFLEAILMDYKVPLVLTPQPEGGYTVTSPLLPELVTEGDSMYHALENAKDALAAVIELYEDIGRTLPQNTRISDANSPVWCETVISAP